MWGDENRAGYGKGKVLRKNDQLSIPDASILRPVYSRPL
jgi:hypothetical protein